MKRPVRLIHAAMVGAISAYAVFWALTPERFLPDDRPWVFVTERCPYVEALMSDVQEDDYLRDAVVVLPAAAASPAGRVGNLACDLASAKLRAEAPWFHVVLRSWICSRLREYAAELRLPGYPYWMYQGRGGLGHDERDEILAAHGLRISASKADYLERADAEQHEDDQDPRSSNADEALGGPAPGLGWRAQAIGL